MQTKETVSLSDNKQTGRCILIYAPPSVGKSASALTLPDDLLIINAEKKPAQDVIKEMLEIRKEPNRKVSLWQFETFDEYIEGIGNLKLEYDACKFPFRSIFFDGMSFLQSEFKLSLEDSRHNKDVVNPQKSREDILTDRFRVEIPDYGSMASMLKRMTFILNQIAQIHNVNVVCTAWAMQQPKWNAQLDYAPYFIGKEYPNVMMGYFNIVGLLVKNPNTVTGYPPVIRFVPTYQDNFLARAGNYKLSQNKFPIYENGVHTEDWIGAGELDFTNIIKVITGDKNEGRNE